LGPEILDGLLPETDANELGISIQEAFFALTWLLPWEAFLARYDFWPDLFADSPELALLPRFEDEIVEAGQTIASLDLLIAESFNSEFLVKFGAFKTTAENSFKQYWLTSYRLAINSSQVVLNRAALITEVAALGVDEAALLAATSLAEYTAPFAAFGTQAASIWERAQFAQDDDGGDGPDTRKWWEKLPTFLQGILRWLFFGWIWMR